MPEEKSQPIEKMKYEFTKEEVLLLYKMVDICLKAGGLSNLVKMHEIVQVLQKPIINTLFKSNIPESIDTPKNRE